MFVSGALALVYEILWMRRFALVFGVTSEAVAATLAAVFFGFTAGSLGVGARAARIGRPLRGFGLLQSGIGVGALLVEPLLSLYQQAYPSLYRSLGGSTAGLPVIETCLTMLALFLPTFCMGGTVPLLGQAAAAGRGRLGLRVGGLYAANILGAALGALSVPFLWLPRLGAAGSYRTCIGSSLVLGAAAVLLDRRGKKFPLEGTGEQTAPAVAHAPAQARPQAQEPLRAIRGAAEVISPVVLRVLAAFSGVLMFVLQVAWERMFAQVHQQSIHSFAVVLAALLAGLGAGAWLARESLRRGFSPRRCLGFGWLGAGTIVFLTPSWFYGMSHGLAYLAGGGGWSSYGLRILWLALPTVMLPGLLAGMALPLLMEMAGRAEDRSAGRVLGTLLAWNTGGAILGALVGAFVLPGWLGLWLTLALAGGVMAVAGELCLASFRWTFPARRLVLPGLILGGFLFLRPDRLPRTSLRPDQGDVLVALQEGSHGIVAVVEKGGVRRIKLNNSYVLGGTASTGDERLQGHLPLLLHPAPKRVAFLGMGTGITAGAALLHPVDRVTAIEIVPEVIQVAGAWFPDANLDLTRSPRVQTLAADARNVLGVAGSKYDVIVGDLVVPWKEGEASLYTAEHFAAVRRALAPGGLFCQWLPLFQLSEAEFNMVAATFMDVFPRTTLWRGDFAPETPALALVGQLGDTLLDPRIVERRVGELRPDDANRFLVHPAGIWIFLVGSLDPADARFSLARRNRDDEPWLEVLGPLNHTGSMRGDPTLFVGRRLQEFLDQVRARSTGPALARLTPDSLRWREAGARLGAASVLTAEGNPTRAAALLNEAVAALPPEIRSAFGPGPVP